MTTITRRDFLKISGGAAAGAGVSLAGVSNAATMEEADIGRATLPFKPKMITRVASLKANEAVPFTFPDASSPCAVIKMGSEVPRGVGPDRDIVAYSTLCTHQGCPVGYDPQARTFKCPCHYSIFDPEKSGQMVCGQATENLPQIVLQYNAHNDTVIAVGVEGLIYGRQSNVL